MRQFDYSVPIVALLTSQVALVIINALLKLPLSKTVAHNAGVAYC